MLKKAMLRPTALFFALLATLFFFFSARSAVKPEEILDDPSFFEEGEKLPDLPLLIIDTDSGEDPDFDLLSAPSQDVYGASICNNDYLRGTLRTVDGRKSKSYPQIKIKVRGNTSAYPPNSQADFWKVPYKLRLSSSASLLDMGEENTFSEWILLKSGTRLNTFTGYALSALCGLPWQLPMKFVNVVLNGDWKGCYILTPAVEVESSRGLIGKNGFLFEEDAYWWKEDKPYFRLEKQPLAMGYTVKYPKSSPLNTEKIAWLHGYMQEFEDLLLAGDEAYTDYIDIESFASYLLAQDIGGNGDGAGSNLFLFIQSGSSDKDPQPKVTVGPLWDFDALFSRTESWSATYIHGTFYFKQLKWSEPFFGLYLQKWIALSPTLYSSLEEQLNRLEKAQGEALQESWELDVRRWGKNTKSFKAQKADVLSYIQMRIGVIDRKLCLSIPDTYFIDVSDYTPVHGNIQYWIDFSTGAEGCQGMNGWAFCTSDCELGQVGVLYGDWVYLADRTSRPDVKKHFSLESESDMFGFEVEYLSEEALPICIVDTENKVLYVE